jgi:hypothetical protein
MILGAAEKKDLISLSVRDKSVFIYLINGRILTWLVNPEKTILQTDLIISYFLCSNDADGFSAAMF